MHVKSSKARLNISSEQQGKAAASGPVRARQRRRADRCFGLKPEYAAIAKQICELGGTGADLAKKFGVDLDTISLWLSISKEFAEACRLGMDAAQRRVERSLYERAVGYTQKVDTVVKQKGRVLIVQRKVPVPADPRAAKIWLQRHEANAALARESPLEALMRQLEGTALRPKDQG